MAYGNDLECCRGVVDPITLLALLAGIAGITVFLRQIVINKITAGKRKKRYAEHDNLQESLSYIFSKGKIRNIVVPLTDLHILSFTNPNPFLTYCS